MAWVWDQSAGKLHHNGQFISNGYAGYGSGKNNPDLQSSVGIGPIPRGQWLITGVYNSTRTGPFTIALSPKPGTDTCGRSAFRIHGDSISNPGKASHGCIILPRAIRELIWNSGDHSLEVVE
jgi:hypothetical protein